MIEQEKEEHRLNYLMRVLKAFMAKGPGEYTIDYDETTCDGYCLYDDIEIEIRHVPYSQEE